MEIVDLYGGGRDNSGNRSKPKGKEEKRTKETRNVSEKKILETVSRRSSAAPE